MTQRIWTQTLRPALHAVALGCFVLGRFYAVITLALLLLSTIAKFLDGPGTVQLDSPLILCMHLFIFGAFAASIAWPRRGLALIAESFASTLVILIVTTIVALIGSWMQVEGVALGEAEQLMASGEILRRDVASLIANQEILVRALAEAFPLFIATYFIAIFFYLMRAYAILSILPERNRKG